MRKFYAEVKTEKGQALTPSALTGVRTAVHRHLTCAPLSQKMFEAKANLFTKENNAKPKHKSSIHSGDIQKLNQHFMEGQNKDSNWKEAEILVESIWFSLSFHFTRRGREEWRKLTRQSFGIQQKKVMAVARNVYVTEKHSEQTRNYQGGAKQSEESFGCSYVRNFNYT